MYFDVETGPAPAFVYTLSLTFDYKDRVYFPVMDCVPRWQMTAKEYAVMQNHTKGNDLGIYICNVIRTDSQANHFIFDSVEPYLKLELSHVLASLIATFLLLRNLRPSELSDGPMLKKSLLSKRSNH